MEQENNVPPQDELQFDHAETTSPDAAVVACAGCKQPVAGYYYQVNSATICVPCREQLFAALAAGSPFLRFIKAGLLGLVAAVVGAGIYYGVTVVSGYELGLIAIVLGLLVGVAVRVGSGNRGGWFYQLVAVGLTYLAVAFIYVPAIYSGMKDEITKDRQAQTQQSSSTAPARMLDPKARPVVLTTRQKGILIPFSCVFALIWPMFDVSIMGYIIKGIALYEAWKINMRPKLLISGPFTMGSPATMSPDGAMPAS